MRLALALLAPALLVALAACGSWQTAKVDLSVGRVPCSPSEIQTDDRAPETGAGWRQWDVECQGVAYRCTQRNAGGGVLTPNHETECVPAESQASAGL